MYYKADFQTLCLKQDYVALLSQQRAVAAQEAWRLDEEIVPMFMSVIQSIDDIMLALQHVHVHVHVPSVPEDLTI